MEAYTLAHLTDGALLRDLAALAAHDRVTVSRLLAHIAEVDARRLYAPAGYPSMHMYCVRELRFSDDVAFKRIRAARAARAFPVIFEAIANGRLNPSAVVLLKPHLFEETAEALLAAAAYKSRSEIERMLAERFPQPELPTRIRAITPSPKFRQLVPEPVGRPDSELVVRRVEPCVSGSAASPLEPGESTSSGAPSSEPTAAIDPRVTPAFEFRQLAPGPVETCERPLDRVVTAVAASPGSTPRPRITPLAPERFALQLTMSRSLHDKLRYSQELLSHQMPSGDVAFVLERALDALITKLEREKFAAASKPRTGQRRGSTRARQMPAEVKRAVWKRDHGQCTFVSETGKRCESRKFLEFDHVEPVARGGRATVSGVRLRCRAHNQLEAERAFGSGFMREKRERARQAAARRRAELAQQPRAARAAPRLEPSGLPSSI
jgi:5-methylcytosine-specific restriction endonuclease McrA